MTDIPTSSKKFGRWMAKRKPFMSAPLLRKAEWNLLSLKTIEQPAATQSSGLVELAICDHLDFANAYDAEQLWSA